MHIVVNIRMLVMCNTSAAIPLIETLCAVSTIFPQNGDFELVTFEVEVEENMGKTIMFNCKVFSLYLHCFELLQAMLNVCLPLHNICQRKVTFIVTCGSSLIPIVLALVHNEILTHHMLRLGVTGLIYLKHCNCRI